MITNNILYLLEAVSFGICLFLGIIIFTLKHKTGLLKFFGITSFIFIFVFFVTFIFEKPEMTILPIEDIEVHSIVEIPKPKTTFHFQDVTDKIKINSNVDYNKTGEYTVGFELNTLTGVYSQSTTLKIVDTTAPEITLEGSETFEQTYGQSYQDPGYKAFDAYEGDLTDKVIIEGEVDTTKEGTYELVYKVSDLSGNETSTKRTINVIKKTINVSKPQDGTKGNKGVIYLTFDDGPSTSITPKILDILKEKNVKATFFILNYNLDGEKLVQREFAEGHTIGIHGYSHKYADIYQSVDTYMENLTKLQDKIMDSTGYRATITRFPGGSSNTISKRYCPGIMTTLCQEVVARGYTYFDWNVSSEDAGGAKTADDVYNNVIKGISKSKQNVVLMHDYSGNTKTLDALAKIIDYGLSNGYTFSNITEDTPMVTHTPHN